MSAPAPELPSEPMNIESPSFGGYAGRPGQLLGVGFWPRAAARVIDLIAHYAVALFAGFAFGVLLIIAARATGQSAAVSLERLRRSNFSVFLFSLLGSVAYEIVCEAAHGSTLGKLMLKMVVVQEDGTPCRVGSAVIRSFAYFIDAIFFGLVGYLAMKKTPQEQRHGDEWAHTIVCKRSDAQPPSLRGGGRFVVALFFAVMVDAALIMIGCLLEVSG